MPRHVHRYIFNMPVAIYKKLREVAFKRNISMSKYVLDALLWRLNQEDNNEHSWVEPVLLLYVRVYLGRLFF